MTSPRPLAPLDASHLAAGMSEAYAQALKSYNEGGLPIGAVLMRPDGEIVARGHNLRVQEGSTILHGEMSALRNAGRRRDWHELTMFTTLSPCAMCSGAAVLHKIPRLVVGERQNFQGKEEWLLAAGAEVIQLHDARCIEMMARFIREQPKLWTEDIAENDK